MKTIIVLFFLIYICIPKAADAQEYAVAVKAGSLGAQAELYRALGNHFNVHIGGTYFKYIYTSPTGKNGKYSYSADMNINDFTLLADYFFSQSSSFRITAGAVYVKGKPDIKATPEISKLIGNDLYDKSNLGVLKVDLRGSKVNPYIGIGFGNPSGGNSHIGATLDIGTYYQGPPKVKLSAAGLLAATANSGQEKIIENNLKWFKWYPVVSLGLAYKF